MININPWRLLMQQAAAGGGGAPIEFISSGKYDGNSSGGSFTISGVQSGDLIIISGSSDSNTPSVPSGWTTGYIDSGTGDSSIRSAWFYAFSSGTSVSVTGLDGGSGGNSIAYIWQAFRYVDQSDPIHTFDFFRSSYGSGSPNPPSITTTIDGCMILALGMLDDDQIEGSVTPPSGFTLIEDNETRYTTNMSAYLFQSSAGSIDPSSFGTSSDANMAYTIALNPS